MRSTSRLLAVALLTGLGLWTRFGRADDAFPIVAPGGLASAEGNAGLGYPLNIGFFNFSSQRYQQVYEASQFSALPDGGYITAVSFRINRNNADFSATLPDIQFDLSTTPQPVGGLSLVFADNVGLDDTVVYRRGPLTLSGTGGPGPNPFDVTVHFTTPFYYNPASGNLLLDIRNFGGGETTQLDATSEFGDVLARTYTDGSGVASPWADGLSASGLVTQFTVEAPEPSTLALSALGAAALLGARRRRAGRR